jgi:hypothetical protein
VYALQPYSGWGVLYFMPSLAYPLLATYPPSIYYEIEPQYMGANTPYQDGGADYISLADTPIRRWYIQYKNYLTSEKELFRTLAASAKFNPDIGSVIGFNFTPIGESLLSSVFYDRDGLVCTAEPASGQSIWTITVKLIKRP